MFSCVQSGGGYAKLRRGQDDAALESAAVWAAPDICRGKFREILKKNGHEAESSCDGVGDLDIA